VLCVKERFRSMWHSRWMETADMLEVDGLRLLRVTTMDLKL
jgi:hypothetical protein